MPSHTAQATLVLEVQPADLRPPWFLPCIYSDTYVCVQAQYQGAIPTGYKLVLGTGRGRARSGRLGARVEAHGPNSVGIFKQIRTFLPYPMVGSGEPSPLKSE